MIRKVKNAGAGLVTLCLCVCQSATYTPTATEGRPIVSAPYIQSPVQQPVYTAPLVPAPVISSVESIEFTNADLAGWSTAGTQNGIQALFGDKDTSVFRSLIDGRADSYFIQGFHQGMAQNLNGPKVNSSTLEELRYYGMVYKNDSNAHQMYAIKKEDLWNNAFALPSFDTAAATGSLVRGGILAYAHFNHFYVELALANIADSAVSVNKASQMLKIIKQKAEKVSVRKWQYFFGARAPSKLKPEPSSSYPLP